MANSTHTHELQTTQTKDFDFIFVDADDLPPFRATYKTYPAAVATAPPPPSVFDQESLNLFHQEFKKLVLASNPIEIEPEQHDWDAADLATPIEPHEIEWLDWTRPSNTPVASPRSLDSAPVVNVEPATIATPAQQAVKPVTGPPLGTLPPVEVWVVKTIGALVALNLLFAGLIVTGTRLIDYRHWFKF
mgnify:CR=1 FL=1